MKRFILFLLNGILVFSLTWCSNPGQNDSSSDTSAQRKTRPSQESWDSEIYLTKLGVRNAIIHSGHLEQYNQQDRVQMNEGVKADFFKDNDHMSTLTADSAVVFQKRNIMHAYKNVIVHSDSGVTLYTERISYSQKTEKITSDTMVTMTTRTDTLHGIGFESNLDLTQWKIKQPWGVTTREMKK